MQRRTNGASVRAIREALGITMTSLAARCKVSKPFMSMVETGASQPSPKVARIIADELGVPLEAVTYPWAGDVESGDDELAEAKAS